MCHPIFDRLPKGYEPIVRPPILVLSSEPSPPRHRRPRPKETPMVDPITQLRLKLLQVVARNPDAPREKLLALKDVQPADLDYLIQHDLIRDREPGRYRVTHFGQMALNRGSGR